MEFSANFFNKIFLLAMQNYIAKSFSLNSYRLLPNHSAFPSGEGGPHGRVVDEEGKVCTAQRTSV